MCNLTAKMLLEAENAYRTKKYIVVQRVGYRYSDKDDNVLYSMDTYYLRNKKRDGEYERAFSEKQNVNGRRLPVSMYVRKYVD